MESVVANLSGRVRSVTHDGRQWLVADAASIVADTVLPGSKGPLFYPAAEIRNAVKMWDGVPITLYHPTDPLTNEHLSASSPGVMDRQGIGVVRASRFDAGGNGGPIKLRHELWFDVAKTASADRRHGTDVLGRLKAGKQLELSTGLYTTNEPAPAGSRDGRGRAYTHVARNHRSDHMAILPDQLGACSVADGCGVLVNANTDKKPAACNCQYPDTVIRNGSGHSLDCPVHESWRRAGGFGNKDKSKGSDGLWVANRLGDGKKGCGDGG